jgi:hypothetical protein
MAELKGRRFRCPLCGGEQVTVEVHLPATVGPAGVVLHDDDLDYMECGPITCEHCKAWGSMAMDWLEPDEEEED